MTTCIREFWLSHPECWIATGKKQQEADQLIYNTFERYNPYMEDDFGKIIYFDQFVRHFSRIGKMSEKTVAECRQFAAELVEDTTKTTLLEASESELIWYLMPWKHTCKWNPIFQTIADWLSLRGRGIGEFPQLDRFFMDTYKKAYSEEAVAAALELSRGPIVSTYDPTALCESHPVRYSATGWNAIPLPCAAEPLVAALQTNEPVAISLSGGVDSMLMCALLKRTGHDVVAIHIVYGNRKESLDERNFIEAYCENLGIPLYIYTVEWLRREEHDREFYEEMTRKLRFRAYKTLERPVLLGHIREDVVENVWTNFARGTHLDNLAKFRREAVEEGVTILRPWLAIHKWDIIQVAEALGLPYLKNTTPHWSNRGKFRNEFHAAIQLQYGKGVDDTVLEVAERIGKQTELLDRLLYNPLLESWEAERRRLNITKAINAELDADGWLRILTNVAHTRLGIAKPTWRACENLVARIHRGVYNGLRITLAKDFTVVVEKEEVDVFLRCLSANL